jgi:hypothetical protein
LPTAVTTGKLVDLPSTSAFPYKPRDLAFHIEDNPRAGMSPEEARRQAFIKLDGVTQTQELHREQGGMPMLETLLQDLRFGLRMLCKHPGFSLVVAEHSLCSAEHNHCAVTQPEITEHTEQKKRKDFRLFRYFCLFRTLKKLQLKSSIYDRARYSAAVAAALPANLINLLRQRGLRQTAKR